MLTANLEVQARRSARYRGSISAADKDAGDMLRPWEHLALLHSRLNIERDRLSQATARGYVRYLRLPRPVSAVADVCKLLKTCIDEIERFCAEIARSTAGADEPDERVRLWSERLREIGSTLEADGQVLESGCELANAILARTCEMERLRAEASAAKPCGLEMPEPDSETLTTLANEEKELRGTPAATDADASDARTSARCRETCMTELDQMVDREVYTAKLYERIGLGSAVDHTSTRARRTPGEQMAAVSDQIEQLSRQLNELDGQLEIVDSHLPRAGDEATASSSAPSDPDELQRAASRFGQERTILDNTRTLLEQWRTALDGVAQPWARAEASLRRLSAAADLFCPPGTNSSERSWEIVQTAIDNAEVDQRERDLLSLVVRTVVGPVEVTP